MRYLTGVATLVSGHLRGQWGRSIYLVATVAIATAALLGLSALLPSKTEVGAQARNIQVANARDGMLPLRYVDVIERLPEVASVYYSTYLPVLCATGGTATLNGYGGPGSTAMLADNYQVDTSTLAAWRADPMGVLVGDKLASQCGWYNGMRIYPRDGFRDLELEVHIVATIRATSATPFANQIAFAHYDHLNRHAPEQQRDLVASIGVLTKDFADTAQLTATIDNLFAHADPPTEARNNSALDEGLRRFGNVQAVLHWVMAAMLACLALVIASLLAHTATERRRQFAVLRALGFHRGFIFTVFASEFALLITVGMLLGFATGLGFIAFLEPSISMVLGSFSPATGMWSMLPLTLALVLVASLLLPALTVAGTAALHSNSA